MEAAETRSIADARDHLSEVVDRIQREHGRLVITRHGRPAAVVLSVEDLESLEETIQILGNASLLAEITEAEEELTAGRTRRLTKTEALGLATGR